MNKIFLDLGRTAETVVLQKHSENKIDCILVGTAVRTDPALFFLFEKLINLVH